MEWAAALAGRNPERRVAKRRGIAAVIQKQKFL